MRKGVGIGDASRESGIKVPTIRYYEEIGLLPLPPRTEGNRRLYDDADLRRALVASGLETIRARHSCAHRAEELLRVVASLRAPSRVPA